MPQELDDFQHDVLRFFELHHGRAIYADDMGGRKTATTLTWLEQTGQVHTVLIVVPKQTHVDHWLSEAEVWAPSLARRRGMGPRRLVTLHDKPLGPSIYVTTYASARIDEIDLRMQHFDTVVFDEGHALKGRTTQVAKMANQLAKAEHCLIVTGTPVMNAPEEMWQYLHMLNPKDFRSYWHWVEEHFNISFASFDKAHPWNQTKIVGGYLEGHEELVRAQLSGVIIQRSISDLFPGEVWVEEPTFTTYGIDMAPKERALYDHLVEKGWGVIPSGVILTKNAISVQTRLRQLSSDWGTVDAGHNVSAKMRFATDDIIRWQQGDGRPVVVFCAFQETARRMHEIFEGAGLRSALFTGAVSAKARAQSLVDYAGGHIDVVVGTIAAMGEGTDGLQYKTNKLVMYDLDWVPGVNDQCIGRLKRSGQKRRVDVRVYFYKASLDVSVVAANRRKISLVAYLKGKDVSDVVYGHVTDKQHDPRTRHNDEIILTAE
jgi:SNF2 family DNA or RNA helicase